MNRVARRLNEKQQARQIVKAARLPWQPMEEVPRSAWPSQVKGLQVKVLRFWKNNKYTVMEWRPRKTAHGAVRHLLVQRVTAGRILRWNVLQRIKNEVAGPEGMAIELYPPESKVIEDCHVYHLWVLPDGYPLPGVGVGL